MTWYIAVVLDIFCLGILRYVLNATLCSLVEARPFANSWERQHHGAKAAFKKILKRLGDDHSSPVYGCNA